MELFVSFYMYQCFACMCVCVYVCVRVCTCVYVCACVCACVHCAHGAIRGQKGSDALVLGLPMVVNHHVGVGN